VTYFTLWPIRDIHPCSPSVYALRIFITHADVSVLIAGVGLFYLFNSFVYSDFSDDVSKADGARISKHDIEMFHDESWKFIYLGSKGQR